MKSIFGRGFAPNPTRGAYDAYICLIAYKSAGSNGFLPICQNQIQGLQVRGATSVPLSADRNCHLPTTDKWVILDRNSIYELSIFKYPGFIQTIESPEKA